MVKKILISIIFTIVFATANATNASLFELDLQQLTNDFNLLNQIEQNVLSNKINNTADMLNAGYFINNNLFNNYINAQSDFVFEWEGFLWGFLCCPVGFFVVAVNSNKTKDNKISYWIGVCANSVLSTAYSITLMFLNQPTQSNPGYYNLY